MEMHGNIFKKFKRLTGYSLKGEMFKPWTFFMIGLGGMLMAGCSYSGQPDPAGSDYLDNIKEHRQNKNQQFRDTSTSPFNNADVQRFDELEYFDIKKKYLVWAQFERLEPGEPFVMPTTGSKTPYYIRYGKLRFTIDGQEEELTVYRNIGHEDSDQYEDYLFVPFKDKTNGETTYSGGRYLDLHMPIYNGELVKLDFNKAYNPFCVYNFDEFDCPIPPEANHLDIAIRAGEKMYELPEQPRAKAAN